MPMPLSYRTPAPPAVLTIAGSDSSGGAGIQADLKTFTALGCYGTSVITALTAQNTTGVQGVHPSPPGFVAQQLDSVLSDTDVKALKTGMLYDSSNAQSVIKALQAHYGGGSRTMPPLVVDPVCVSTSGHELLHPDAVDVIVKELFPLAHLITPNRQEAELFLSRCEDFSLRKIESLGDMLTAARNLLSLGPNAVLVKGGHLTATLSDVDRLLSTESDVRLVKSLLLDEKMEVLKVAQNVAQDPQLVVDVLCEKPGKSTLFVRPRLDSMSTHGTGCTLSAALVCMLARGDDLARALENATLYTHLGIEHAFPMGSGHGPLNHIHSTTSRVIALPSPVNPHPLTYALIKSTSDVWKKYVEHDFVKQLGSGTLRRESFVHFIKQDYHYLKYYARAYGLLVAKGFSFSAMKPAAQTIMNVITESVMHKSFCAQWGVSEEELENTPESAATTAYGAFLLDTGIEGDYAKLVMALASCLLGYGEVGLWLKKEAAKPKTWVKLEDNPYQKWIDDYSGEMYQSAVKTGIALIEDCAVADPPSAKRFEEWKRVWARCTLFEKRFWDMAMELS